MTLEKGKIYSLVGSSGSGKSTIASVLCVWNTKYKYNHTNTYNYTRKKNQSIKEIKEIKEIERERDIDGGSNQKW
jgi:ABC-type dipeptide/oligopeptide/nickel transport system ATPase subunit